MAELTRGDTQTTLHQFYVMKYEDGVRAAGVRSKRMQKALKRIHNQEDADVLKIGQSSTDSDESAGKCSRAKKRGRQLARSVARKFAGLEDADLAVVPLPVCACSAGAAASAPDEGGTKTVFLSSHSESGTTTDEDLRTPYKPQPKKRPRTKRPRT